MQKTTAPGQTELYDIDELRQKYGVRRAVYRGVCSQMGWRKGKRVREDTFRLAFGAFEAAPMDRPAGKEAGPDA